MGLTCSRSEGFGRVTAEYMHAGLAVIASDTGANPELVENGINGFLYRNGDVVDLSKRIAFFMDNREEIKRCGERGLEIARTKFTATKNADAIYDLYESIIEQRGASV